MYYQGFSALIYNKLSSNRKQDVWDSLRQCIKYEVGFVSDPGNRFSIPAQYWIV